MSTDLNRARALIEAALYSSGRPLSREQLTRAGGLTSMRKAVSITRQLAREFNRVMKALEVTELPSQKFVMQLKPRYSRIARRFSSRPLAPPSALKVLSYVAYSQPVTALELTSRRGPRVYGHLKLLEELGFIEAQPVGKTKSYRTTPSFAEYFGLSSDPPVMKQQLTKLARRIPAPKALTA